MTSKIVVSNDEPEVTVNIVPVSIQYSGPADTSTYFTPSKATETVADSPVETCQFRGLRLVGEKVDIGDRIGHAINCSEFLVNNAEDGKDEITTAKQYTGVAKFTELAVYGHDATAPLNSKWKMIGEWDKIAHVIHS